MSLIFIVLCLDFETGLVVGTEESVKAHQVRRTRNRNNTQESKRNLYR